MHFFRDVCDFVHENAFWKGDHCLKIIGKHCNSSQDNWPTPGPSSGHSCSRQLCAAYFSNYSLFIWITHQHCWKEIFGEFMLEYNCITLYDRPTLMFLINPLPCFFFSDVGTILIIIDIWAISISTCVWGMNRGDTDRQVRMVFLKATIGLQVVLSITIL